MIIYGTKPVHLKTVENRIVKCGNCDTQGHMAFYYSSSHFHVFWIPMFPYRRKGGSSCTNCGEELKPKQMPEHVKRAYKETKKEVKLPIWQFSGLALIALLIAYSIYASGKTSDQKDAYIASPRTGDVYSYETENGYYSTLKIAEITSDSLYVIPNEYEVERAYGIYKIDKPENYASDYIYGISRDEIERMYVDKEIYSIEREDE
ncbi:hypothetical protein [uncultured Dokdonia sp.]|uniref:hypothetical protein n=1 Tax=uncultured Dokdonia sp. TaxID=575653 RepID=UPI0026139DE0|nr:hypothetical protein [uncultured Dokdonia sp.]